MTAAVPDSPLRALARPRAEQKQGAKPSSAYRAFATEPQDDRTFITLLSLNFMLLAFFIVLGAAASADKARALAIAQNVRLVFAGNEEAAKKSRTTLLTARQALQAGVSDAFTDLLPAQPRFYVDNSDRTDVDVPQALLAPSADIELVYDNIAQVLQMAPAGFRYTLLITGGGETSVSGQAAHDFAGSLVRRGVAPQNILIGSSETDAGHVRLSFLVFEGELEDDGEPWTSGLLAPPPEHAIPGRAARAVEPAGAAAP